MSWKVYIVMDILSSYGNLIWIDSSVSLISGDGQGIKNIIRQVLLQNGTAVENSCFSFVSGPSQIDANTLVNPAVKRFFPLDSQKLSTIFGGQSHSFLATNFDLNCRNNLWIPLLICSLTPECMDPSGHATRNCLDAARESGEIDPKTGEKYKDCRHMFDASILTAVLNDFYDYNPDKYRLASTERILVDTTLSKQKLGILGHSDKKRPHILTESEVVYFLQHVGVADVEGVKKLIGGLMEVRMEGGL